MKKITSAFYGEEDKYNNVYNILINIIKDGKKINNSL